MIGRQIASADEWLHLVCNLQEIKELFEVLDSDKDGYIDAAELRR